MMRRRVGLGLSCAVLSCAALAPAQTHAVKKPETVVRAVAVFEWTGDAAKPTASRVVPVSVFIDGHLEDGGVYLARPIPLELNTGTVFEVQKAGAPEGTLDLSYTRHYVSNGTPAYDDGWLGYGPFKLAAQPILVAAKKGGSLPQVITSGGSGPHLSNGGAASPDKAASPPVDRSDAVGGGTTVAADKDPDGPSTRRRTTEANGNSEEDASKDVDRPTLKRRSPAEQKAAEKKKDVASITGSGSLNDDPDRPNLHRGKPASRMDEEDLPPLKGVPADLQQAVAVSDAKDRPEHPFDRPWESEEERTLVTTNLEEMARAQLTKYELAAVPSALSGAAAPASKAPAQPVTTSPASTRIRRRAAASTTTAVHPAQLKSEALRAYTLSYGGAATYVYAAASPGMGGVDRYVVVVAQREPSGSLKMALANVTDARHLDRTPWMRLIDAVDAEASNRASLLFELRAQSSRQFALYRVIGAAAEQTFITGTPE